MLQNENKGMAGKDCSLPGPAGSREVLTPFAVREKKWHVLFKQTVQVLVCLVSRRTVH
jgi:hypothetical protein